ncbi:putative armadillo-like helical, CPL domain, pumilio domain-containing protein [Dioscorea sansibarensis]
MAAKEQLGQSKKRKRDSHPPVGGKKALHRKLPAKGSGKPPKAAESKRLKPNKPDDGVKKKAPPETPRERRLAAKEMAEARKKKRKPHYSLEKELALLWEKMRRANTGKEEKSKLISEALWKMKGKTLEIASSHVSARVLQTCIKYCSQAERDAVFEELKPHLLNLSRKKYAVHLVKKLLDNATKKQIEGFISSLHGHVASLLRHTVGSAVVEHAFQLGNASQKQGLLMEMYSTELQLFKDLTRTNASRLVDIISKLGLQKTSVLQHMISVIEPLLDKGIIDYSIVHTALVEYFTIADKISATDVLQQLSPLLVQGSSVIDEDQPASQLLKNKKRKRTRTLVPLLVRMMGTRDGLKISVLCIKHGSAKERKKIVKGMKDHVRKLALDQFGSLLLICVLSVVDDTKLVTKIVIRELQTTIKELILDRNGRRPMLELLHPRCSRYLSPDDLACLNLTVPSLCSQSDDRDGTVNLISNKEMESSETTVTDNNASESLSKDLRSTPGSKKDSLVRRRELLVDSGFAEAIIESCIENVAELLRSNFGREVLYEVAVGGADGILNSLTDRIGALHEAIASVASLPKKDDSEEEHVFENFHSSRTIRKLILSSPTFATTLWTKAMESKCEMWAQGHSCKVVSAYLELSDPNVKEMVKSELQLLVDRGVLKCPGPDHDQAKKES